jgi:predicted transcriptional regulator
MDVLWESGTATVAELQIALTSQKLAYTTVMTTLQVLEKKGFVRHETVGRAYVYVPLVSRAEMRRSALKNLLATWFDASPNLLVTNLLDERELDTEELLELLTMVKRRRTKK